MRQRNVDPRKIVVPETRVTSAFDSETLAMLRQSMAAAGMISPIICIEHDSQMVLVDGLHRLTEALNLAIDRIPVAIIEGGEREAYLYNLSLNVIRGRTRPGDVLKVLQALYAEHQMGTDEIAERTGLSRRYIEDLLVIARARPEVVAALDDEEIGKGHAMLLAGVSDEAVQLRLLAQQRMYRWTIAQLKAQIEATMEEVARRVETPPPPAPVATTSLPCMFCGQPWPIGQLANPTTCPICAGILHQSYATARLEAEHSASSLTESPPSEA